MEGTETGDTSSGESLINELVTVHLTTGGTGREQSTRDRTEGGEI